MIDAEDNWRPKLKELPTTKHYVVKVDQGVKGRFKKGLVLLDRPADGLAKDVAALLRKGFRYVLIEEYRKHNQKAEYYLSIERTREGNVCLYSTQGGINVEDQGVVMKRAMLPGGANKAEIALGLPKKTLTTLNEVFDANHFGFLEINPLVVAKGQPQLLDAAVEVDEEAASFVQGAWTSQDFRWYSARQKLPQEVAVEELASQSQASFRLEVLNPNGQVFLLLSGGGASVVLADEVSNQGFGKELGNYGEYSGNPNEEETLLYTRQILSLMVQSKAKRKVLIIGGGVANFTDVRATFQGVIRALDEVKAELRKQGIKVFVRRGGPYEKEGLATMRAYLEQEGLYGLVASPELMLAEIVPQALTSLKEAK
jgi:succinyl-CoA synthetase beta subunit